MRIKIFILSLIVLGAISITAQQQNMNQNAENPPYHQIPDAPEDYDNVNVAARMIDGLGYRYYWSTKDLRDEDLAYRPSEDSRTTGETLEHLYGLSKVIANVPSSTPNIRPLPEEPKMTFEEQRRKTLENFQKASNYLKSSKRKSMKNMKIIFQRGEKTSEFPFWNMLNGPLADAIYHTGQIAAYRRASGNPQFKGVSVFTGKTKE